MKNAQFIGKILMRCGRIPNLDITNDLFEIDGTHITCCGGTAALDMMLYLISQAHGAKLAAEISKLLFMIESAIVMIVNELNYALDLVYLILNF